MIKNPVFSDHIDLRGTPCPVNFIRCRLAIEDLGPDKFLQVDLDRGEPEQMVISGLIDSGHQVEIIHESDDWIRLIVNCNVK